MTGRQIANIQIRRARPGDEPQIAKVHIKSWQEAYRDLVSEDYQNALSNELDERIAMWTSILLSPKRWTWVAESPNGIVGFALFGSPRDPSRENHIELGAIYLLESHKCKGIGFFLLASGFEYFKIAGYLKAYCWVLKDNPTIKFYEKTGAVFSGHSKEDDIGEQMFTELAYDWNTLELSRSF